MNPLPPNADELVSAYLDGQAAPDEIAIVEASPELMERVEALRSVADLLGDASASPVPPAQAKEAHISAALDAFDALFAGGNDAETAPSLAAVPASEPVPQNDERPAPPATDTSGVTSLTQVRERRRPRRFNSGVIAAAAAAVLLFVAVAAFGLGGNDSLDVATDSAAEAVASTADDATDSADDAMDAAAMDEAMDDEEAMDDQERTTGLSELQAAEAPAAAEAMPAESDIDADAVAGAAADDQDAMADDDAMDDEEAMEEEAADEETMADAVEADGDAFSEPFPFFIGEFPDQAALRSQIEELADLNLVERLEQFEPGLFPGCQPQIQELAASDVPTLLGEALIDGQLVEVHRLVSNDSNDSSDMASIVLVDVTDCSVVAPEG